VELRVLLAHPMPCLLFFCREMLLSLLLSLLLLLLQC
jgi:hypothetical protein